MQLSPHFSLEEFVATQHRGVDNSLPGDLFATAKATCEMLERIRAFLSEKAGKEVPLIITSGYRCEQLNRMVGSQPTSDHPKAMAVDWIAPSFGSPYKLAATLVPAVDDLGIGQLIHEFGSWVHTSTRTPDKLVNRIITIGSTGTFVGVLPA
jgi:hypothetical protein